MEKQANKMETVREIDLRAGSGMACLVLNSLLMLVSLAIIIVGAMMLESHWTAPGLWVTVIIAGTVYLCLVCPLLFAGLRVIRPNEAMVITLFGRYIGTLKGAGLYFVNPFAVGMPVPNGAMSTGSIQLELEATAQAQGQTAKAQQVRRVGRKLSLKAMTLSNAKQKINDKLGNPINIGIVVIWRVADTAKAMFSVDNFMEFLSIQCDSALRNIVRLYPYDAMDNEEGDEKSLRGSSVEISEKLLREIQEKVAVAGLEIMEARITHLAYAPEIAAAMLQRQQASAIVDARQLIVEGAVGMVDMALEKLSAKNIVELDDERKAAMVSNLMVVLCGNRDAQPVVNSGTLY